MGAKFMIEEWGYPPIGVGMADTPAGGHELIMLDYRACGKRGEPPHPPIALRRCLRSRWLLGAPTLIHGVTSA